MKSKNLYKFATFDIKDITEIPENNKAIILHVRKSLLFNDQHVWIKKILVYDDDDAYIYLIYKNIYIQGRGHLNINNII